jgi:hypothetical protein
MEFCIDDVSEGGKDARFQWWPDLRQSMKDGSNDS